MARATLGLQGTLLLPEKYRLELALSVGDGPTRFRVGPQEGQGPLSLRVMVEKLAEMLDLASDLGPVAKLPAAWPWSEILAVEVAPELTVEATARPSVALALGLFKGGQPGIRLPPQEKKPSWLRIEPEFTVYDLIVSFQQGVGVDIRAKVEFAQQKGMKQELRLDPPPAAQRKTQLVSFPFPAPPPANPNLQVRYLGLGQRFGLEPKPDATVEKLLKQLETTFKTNDPETLLRELAGYYRPNGGWFFGADLSVRGWEVRALLNDPSLYGLEVACKVPDFEGLQIQILYQKLGSGVGVFYGEVAMPTRYRTLQLGVVSLTIPSFKLWIYTNGDFKVSVGWPLGPNSIGIQVSIFTGGGGFYFAKLRSADNPQKGRQALLARNPSRSLATPDYDPIIEFGLGLWFGVGRSFSYGPFSAELSVTLQGTFQGLLAWEAPPAAEPEKGKTISRAPDYHWFAATLGVVGVLQGSVDLKVIQLSVLVEVRATAAIAFETDYGTRFTVSAGVHVEASLKIVFFRITVGFSMTVSESFGLTSSANGTWASISGPQNEAFKGMSDWPATGLDRLERLLAESAPTSAVAAPATSPPPPPGERQTVDVGFLLQPAAVYSGGSGAGFGVAALVIDTEPPKDAPSGTKAPLELLMTRLANWLLRAFSSDGRWSSVVKELKPRAAPKPPDPPEWEEKLERFVADELLLKIEGINFDVDKDQGERPVCFLPMLDDLQLSWTGGGPVVFADKARTSLDYPDVVSRYFAELALSRVELDDAGRATSRPAPDGPSLMRLIFGDYFLTVSRHLAKLLAERDDAGGMPTHDEAVEAGGLGSRYLLNGLQLPDPATVPPAPPVDLEALELGSAYALTGQQFPLGPATGTFAATLAVRPKPGEAAKAIAFAEGESATSSMEVEPLPPEPAPVWSGLDAESRLLGSATIALTAIPPASPRALWVATRNRLPWKGPQGTKFVVPLAPELAAAARKGPVRLTVQSVAPPASEESDQPSAPALTIEPTLLVSVRAHRVDRLRAKDLQETAMGSADADPTPPRPESPYLRNVYRLEGTDDATRGQLAAALAAGALERARVEVLYDASATGYKSDQLKPEEHPVVLAKTSLSTTSQPGSLARPPALDELGGFDGLGPSSALLADVPGVAQLLWELSVVQTESFYLRYANAAGEGLPDSIFSAAGEVAEGEEKTGDSAELTLAITFPADSPVESWHNSFLAVPPADAGSLYIAMDDAAGQRVQALHPTYPPGCAGFEGTWTLAPRIAEGTGELYDEDWAARLYQLLQFKVEGGSSAYRSSLWSTPLSVISKGDGLSDRYRQVLPAYRFLAKPAPDPYDAVGKPVPLTFRAGDVFGNVLGDATHLGRLPLLYNDPLLGPGEWPGMRVAHRFRAEGDKKLLRLAFEFDPKAIDPAQSAAGGEAAHTDKRVEAALERYATAAAQLRDPGTTLRVGTSLQPGPVGDGEAVKAQLLAYVKKIEERLRDGGGAESLPLPPLEFEIEPQALADLAADVVPVEVTLALSRDPSLVYADADGERIEKSVESSLSVAADLDPDARTVSEDAGDEVDSWDGVSLLPYAEDFEAAFAGWDGSESGARLTVRADHHDLAARSGTPPLWALRLSPEKGVDVVFDAGKAAYFALAPLQVELAGGPAKVPGYDKDLDVEYVEETFTGIDLDQWAAGFLTAMDEVLSPGVGTALAAADPETYGELMLAKSVLAEALARGVQPVFAGPSSPGVDGDLDAARDVFEQAVLGRLSAAYGISTVAQVPATVSVGREEGESALRLFGPVAATKAPSDVTLGAAKLALRKAPAGPSFLTFPVTVGSPERVANVKLDLCWKAGFLEHPLDDPPIHGYRPSEWLRMARRPVPDRFEFELGQLDVPVPARGYPTPPVLEGHLAEGVPPAHDDGSLGGYMRWRYGADLQLSDPRAADFLWLSVAYNDPPAKAPKLLSDVLPPGLFEALASFTVAWPTLRPRLQALPGKPAPEADAAIAAFWEQAKTVTRAWARRAGVEDPWKGDEHPFAASAEEPEPARRSDRYAIDFDHFYDRGRLTVFAQAQPKDGRCDAGSLIWPLINDCRPAAIAPVCDPPEQACSAAPEPTGCWYQATYAVGPPKSGATGLQLRWEPLDLLSLQTACSSCHLTRNADLSGEGSAKVATNPAFVYRTPEVGFDKPVLPTIVVPHAGPVQAQTTLAESLLEALRPLGRAGTGVSDERLVKLSCDYSYSLAPAPPGQDPLRAKIAVLLVDQKSLKATPTANVGITLEELCHEIADDCQTWFDHFEPSTEDATLSLTVALFANVAGAQLPLVQAQDLELEVPRGWWKS